jgi:hypothetical protein
VFDSVLVSDGSTISPAKNEEKTAAMGPICAGVASAGRGWTVELAGMVTYILLLFMASFQRLGTRNSGSVESRSADYFHCPPIDLNYLQTSAAQLTKYLRRGLLGFVVSHPSQRTRWMGHPAQGRLCAGNLSAPTGNGTNPPNLSVLSRAEDG